MTDESGMRIESLERDVRRLSTEIANLREELRRLRTSVAAPVPEHPPAARPAAPPEGPLWKRVLDPPEKRATRPRIVVSSPTRVAGTTRPARSGLNPDGLGFEDLVGRYGAMALAALAIMSGIGIFLSWAIAQNLIGPSVRVAAGFAAAALLGALGWRFRSRGARTFGNTMMGIALAVVHVVAWGAGPGLQVFPSILALAIAAVASIALAILAWRSGEESLFVVGVGGALIAPFVTTPGRGNGEALLVFGWLVLTSALYGMRERPWRHARWLLAAAGVVYAGAAMTAAWSSGATFGRELPAIFALACAWGALALGGSMHAPMLTRSYLTAGIPPLLYVSDVAGVFRSHLAIAAVATATLLVAIHRREEEGDGWLIASLLIPLGFLWAALAPLDDMTSTTGALIAAGWAAGIGLAGWLVEGRRRDVLWTVAGVSAGVAIVLATSEREILMIAGLSLHAGFLSHLMRRERAKLLLLPIVLALAAAVVASGNLFNARPPYAYTPFLTEASLGALLLVLGIGVVGWNASKTDWPDGPSGSRRLGVVGGLGIIAAFIWGRTELASAYSPDIATFLLIVYYATCGLASIFIGRRSAMPDLRRVGLALTVFAALKAVAQAYELRQIGLRVGSFLLVGAFMLAVAYWYRATGEAETREGDVA